MEYERVQFLFMSWEVIGKRSSECSERASFLIGNNEYIFFGILGFHTRDLVRDNSC